MIKLGLHFLIISVLIFTVKSAPPAKETEDQNVKNSRINISERKVSNCKNTSLLILFGSNGTTLKFTSVTNDALLNAAYSLKRGIQQLLRFAFSQFFPAADDDTSEERSDYSVIKIIKKKIRNAEIVSVKFADEVLLQSGRIYEGSGNERNITSGGKESVICGHLNEVKLVVEPGLKVNARDDVNMTALHWAIFFGDANLTDRLIKRGADVNAEGFMELAPLHLASAVAHVNITRLLIDGGADVNAGKSTLKPLHVASTVGRPEVVSLLAERGADLNAGYGKNALRALHIAAKNGNLQVVERLTKCGADVYAKLGKSGTTALHEAASQGHAYVVRHLLERNMNVNVKDSLGRSPLIVAADRTFAGERILATVKILLNYGADVKAKDNNGNTAISLSEKYKELNNILIKNI